MRRELDEVIFRRNKSSYKHFNRTCEKSTQTIEPTERSRGSGFDGRTKHAENYVSHSYSRKENERNSGQEKKRSRRDEKKPSRENSHEDRKSLKDSRKQRHSSSDRKSRKRSRSRSREKRDNSHKPVDDKRRRTHEESRSSDSKHRTTKKECDLRELILKRNTSRNGNESKDSKKGRSSPRKVTPEIREKMDTADVKSNVLESQKRRESPSKAKQKPTATISSDIPSIKSSDSEIEIIKEKALDVESKDSPKSQEQRALPKDIGSSIVSTQAYSSLGSSESGAKELSLEPPELQAPVVVVDEKPVPMHDVEQSNEPKEILIETKLQTSLSSSPKQLNLELQIPNEEVRKEVFLDVAEAEVNFTKVPELVDELAIVKNESFNSSLASKENLLNQSQENGNHKSKRRSYQKDVQEDGTVIFSRLSRPSKAKKQRKEKSQSSY